MQPILFGIDEGGLLLCQSRNINSDREAMLEGIEEERTSRYNKVSPVREPILDGIVPTSCSDCKINTIGTSTSLQVMPRHLGTEHGAVNGWPVEVQFHPGYILSMLVVAYYAA